MFVLIPPAWLLALLLPFAGAAVEAAPQEKPKSDPAAWGGNHVGKPIPEYIHGDECLFCHRNDIGAGWQKTAHGTTIRQKEDAPELASLLRSLPTLSEEVTYFMGSRSRVRLLKKAGYGKFSILSAQAILASDRSVAGWVSQENPRWDDEKFEARCAGCHTTAVDPGTRTFSAFGLDCYTCHGSVGLEHSTDTSLVWLSKKRRGDARAVTSICAQCHLREGRSKSTGLPYPNNFVAGDNLFQDFEADFSRAEARDLNPGDRHVYRNVRDVVIYGIEEVTCLTCHNVHAGSSRKHRLALKAEACTDCHYAEGPMQVLKPYAVHSPLCEY